MGQIDSQVWFLFFWKFLIYLKGTSFETKLIGTGFGGFLVNPLMERLLEQLGENQLPNRAQAEAIMERALKVLYYRDKSTYNNWSIGFAEQVNWLKIFFKNFN